MQDFAIIGGGIVGVATAMHLLRVRPGSSVVLLEKEASLGQHQTGHNSGVVHAGVYYAPGSLKARFCKEGALATYEFCRENDIACERIGKLIVATKDSELGPLDALAGRCGENGIAIERLSASEARRLEPNIRTVGGILVPSTGITDYPAIVEAMHRQVVQMGGRILFGSEVVDIRETSDAVEIIARNTEVSARTVIVCGGIMADRLAHLCGLDADFRMVPFRGEYYQLPAQKNNLVHHLIYPVPDPKLPFLGVHLTPMVGGFITVGPNAVLGLSREGYPKFSVDLRDFWQTISFPGFWPMAKQHLQFGAGEMWNAVYKRGYLNVCRRYCPDLELDDLLPYPAGIRAQAVLRDGTLVHDFLIRRTSRTLHICNAPSPAATSAIPIAKHIVELVLGGNSPQMEGL